MALPHWGDPYDLLMPKIVLFTIISQTISSVIYFNQTYKPSKINRNEAERINGWKKRIEARHRRKMIQSCMFGCFVMKSFTHSHYLSFESKWSDHWTFCHFLKWTIVSFNYCFEKKTVGHVKHGAFEPKITKFNSISLLLKSAQTEKKMWKNKKWKNVYNQLHSDIKQWLINQYHPIYEKSMPKIHSNTLKSIQWFSIELPANKNHWEQININIYDTMPFTISFRISAA